MNRLENDILKENIYLDYHSTTPIDRRVADRIYQTMIENFGNASSIDHEWGDRAATAVNQAAQQVAELVNAFPREILWTSGATESINLAIQGSYPQNTTSYKIALSPIEHKAVLDTCQALEKQGKVELIYLKINEKGRLDLNDVENICSQGISLLCVMAANNEIGNIYPIEAIGKIAKQYNTPFLCDASQAVGKIPIQFEQWGITYLAISAHKLYGPQGVGALVIRKGNKLTPLLFGGGQQNSIRPGTLNVPGIVGLGEACRLRQLEMTIDETAIAQKRDRLQSLLLKEIPGLILNGDLPNRLAGNLHISIPDIPNSAVIARVRSRLAISTGSACTSGVDIPSHVLRAIGMPSEVIEGALRIGIGKFTTDIEIEQAAEILTIAIQSIRDLMR